jgi:hypothetical protein
MANTWHLLKASDREVYGPTSLDQLKAWAAEAKISPLDKVSPDNKATWQRAPMVAELQMDWLLEMPDSSLYGPTSVGTLQEFLATGEIEPHITVINCLTGNAARLQDLPFFKASPHHVRSAETVLQHSTPGSAVGTVGGATDEGLRNRILWLEKQVMELQHLLGQAENHIESLRQQYVEATGQDPL